MSSGLNNLSRDAVCSACTLRRRWLRYSVGDRPSCLAIRRAAVLWRVRFATRSTRRPWPRFTTRLLFLCFCQAASVQAGWWRGQRFGHPLASAHPRRRSKPAPPWSSATPPTACSMAPVTDGWFIGRTALNVTYQCSVACRRPGRRIAEDKRPQPWRSLFATTLLTGSVIVVGRKRRGTVFLRSPPKPFLPSATCATTGRSSGHGKDRCLRHRNRQYPMRLHDACVLVVTGDVQNHRPAPPAKTRRPKCGMAQTGAAASITGGRPRLESVAIHKGR